jgi:hypothetical protein
MTTRHKHHRPAAGTGDRIALASACDRCAPMIGNPPAPEWAPGRHMAPVHASCVPALVAAGWVLTTYPHEPPDVVCAHYHAAWWQDGLPVP